MPNQGMISRHWGRMLSAKSGLDRLALLQNSIQWNTAISNRFVSANGFDSSGCIAITMTGYVPVSGQYTNSSCHWQWVDTIIYFATILDAVLYVGTASLGERTRLQLGERQQVRCGFHIIFMVSIRFKQSDAYLINNRPKLAGRQHPAFH